MYESIAAIKARLLVDAIQPRYPLDITWLASRIYGKPVVIDEQDFPMNICAIVVDKPEYETVHIGVNSNRPHTSQRFSVVHELAHQYLGHRGDISFIEDQEDPVLRSEADAFATEMLMPKYRILLLAERYREPFPLIRLIMRGHDVSLEAACRRLIELEIYRGAFVYFENMRPIFAYNTPGFNMEVERIKNIPKLKRGCIISTQETVCNIKVNTYFQSFKNGNIMAAWVEEKPTNLYQNLIKYGITNHIP